MSDNLVIIGGGASAVHATQTALEKGRAVTLIDIGVTGPEPALPGASLNGLKTDLEDPVAYFLGEDYSSLILPSNGSEYYGFPPSKEYVLRDVIGAEQKVAGIAPLSSYAGGGLAQAWTAGSYPFTDGELEAFPIGWSDMEPAYSEVARRIGVSGVTDDDLSAFMPTHEALQTPIPMDEHSQHLLATYSAKRAKLTAKHNMYLGRARIASLSQDHDGRPACSRCGRCLWGCPTQSIYTPSVTLEHLRRQPGFSYVPGVRVDRFEFDDGGRVKQIIAHRLEDGEAITLPVETLVLAAGTIGSARILLQSLHHTGQDVALSGLMDNRQVLMPFINLARVGSPFDDNSYQYNQLAIGAPMDHPHDYVHGLMTTLTTALIHPVAQSLPVGMRTATGIFRNIHGALGLVNINFADTRRADNTVSLEPGKDGKHRLVINYTPSADEADRIKRVVPKFRNFLMDMGCFAPPPMTRLRPMGASVHYAGVMPMLSDGGDFTTDRAGRLRPFENLIVADGSTFTSLPAKNLTFTLMANATRIMHEALA
ncbi:GMC oxidoreductase [Asticcacaulis sp. ZE23SCel15]|uniref:GMC oxidoreductase n=1 Tax=Asticcacaulis sp. ZE23SCel15 TaxID=3059027 RepID=UPI00265EAD8A|nr:GMC oxidoreductase [Asticcacaulis sp. ZE23SCel15]WKL58330.1 GMC oxidoreductase [Asticcacaulis sp. ZE23SCel15]